MRNRSGRMWSVTGQGLRSLLDDTDMAAPIMATPSDPAQVATGEGPLCFLNFAVHPRSETDDEVVDEDLGLP